VVNHTSDQHPWFQKARRAKKGSIARDFYMWSDTAEKYKDARIIFKDFESSNWTWDPVAKAYYWHRFYFHQPDLNYDSPNVHNAIFKVADFWFDMGVDGLRLDAVPYLYAREGTNCENLPETFKFLEKLRAHIDRNHKNKILLAEANQWPEDAVAYFGKGDQCNMNFHFPLMPRMYMALQMEDRFPVIDILEQTPEIPESCQWALFLRNHDELTLEMVTDEERDYMYRVYASDPKARINLGIRRRLAPLLGNNRRKIELMNSLLFSLPGSPIIYYGDEIGMGDNYYLGDRNGVRTPMQWSSDKNAGFSRANPQELLLPIIIEPEYHYEAINVENQEKNLSSLLWWMRRLISMRKRFKSLSRGSISFILSDNLKVFSFIRKYQDEIVLIVINLSAYSQVVELDLSDYKGYVPEEIQSRNKFPRINETDYILTPGPNDFYWFVLKNEKEAEKINLNINIPVIQLQTSWDNLPEDIKEDILEEHVLTSYLQKCSWFSQKDRKIEEVKILDNIKIPGRLTVNLYLFEVSFVHYPPEIFLLPLSNYKQDSPVEKLPEAAIVTFINNTAEGEILYDSFYSNDFHKELLDIILTRKILKGEAGEIQFQINNKIKEELIKTKNNVNSRLINTKQSNTQINYNNLLLVKFYRYLKPGINPDIEIIKFLNKKGFSQAPELIGNIDYYSSIKGKENKTMLTMIRKYIPNEGSAWKYTLENINQAFARVLENKTTVPKENFSRLSIKIKDIEPHIKEFISVFYLDLINKLGKTTGELHVTLADTDSDPNFTPEPFSMLYQRSVYQSTRNTIKRALNNLKIKLDKLPANYQENANEILNNEKIIIKYCKIILEKKLMAMKLRTHGDYSLEQLIYTGKDFVIINFEGNVLKPLSERKLKRLPFRDVAGILRSLYFAVYTAISQYKTVLPEDVHLLEPWAEIWYHNVSAVFLESYLNTVQNSPFIPAEKADYELLIGLSLLDKFFASLEKELNSPEGNVIIPLKGILYMINHFL
jgi:maltose alpha-D-glucosyltransferase/alpha-amylase